MKYQIMAMVPVREPFDSAENAQSICAQISADNPNACYKIFPVLERGEEEYMESERPYIDDSNEQEIEKQKFLAMSYEYCPISLIP